VWDGSWWIRPTVIVFYQQALERHLKGCIQPELSNDGGLLSQCGEPIGVESLLAASLRM
jgi:hypothetical protein